MATRSLVSAVSEQSDGPKATVADLFDFCRRNNEWAETYCPDRWFYVHRDDDTGKHSVQALDGNLAREVRSYQKGWRPDYLNWAPARIEGLSRKLAEYIMQGGF